MLSSALKNENDPFCWYGFSVVNSVQEKLGFGCDFFFVDFISAFCPTYLKCSHFKLSELDSFEKLPNICLCFTKIKVII